MRRTSRGPEPSDSPHVQARDRPTSTSRGSSKLPRTFADHDTCSSTEHAYREASDLRKRVELTRELSNPSRTFRAAIGLAAKLGKGSGKRDAVSRSAQYGGARQIQTRLGPDELMELIAAYQAGVAVKQLAADFRISRSTVTAHMTRHGVRLHYPALTPDEVSEAARLYREGQSLANVGQYYGVAPSTINKVLREAGVPLRDTHGRERK